MNSETPRAPKIDTSLFVNKQMRNINWKQVAYLKIDLNPLDFASDKDGKIPLIMKIHINKYLAFYLQTIHMHFQQYSPPALQEKHMWLEYAGKELESNIPFSVNLDLYDIDEDLIELQLNYRRGKSVSQFRMFKTTFMEDMQNICLWNLKQAVLCRFKNKGLNRFLQILTYEQLTQLVKSYVQDEECDQFYELYDQLMDLNQIKNDETLTIPVRIYISNIDGRIQLAQQIDKIDMTIGEMLNKLLPDLSTGVRIKCCRQQIDMLHPLRSLLFDFYKPDGFLYLVIKCQ